MFFITRTSKYTNKKYYWCGFSKQYPGYWSLKKPINAYYEEKHAKAVMTRMGWVKDQAFDYSIEPSN